MKFVDTARIIAQSGDGGPGCGSMRREKFIEFGGPDGGDGGKGGDVLIQGNPDLGTLQDYRIHPHQRAGHGHPGMSAQKTGKSGKDLIIQLPVGTILTDEETGDLVMEVLDSQPRILLKGGKGGLGNVHFKSSTNRAPRYAQPGLPGESRSFALELKLMADVGLVGFPNAGKSTFISSVSAARPKVADYPFTTLVPNLGVVSMADYQSFVIADIPGIIENAHLGQGLGDQFLRHIQRTSVLAILVEVSAFAERPALEAYKILLHELGQFSAELLEKKRLVLITKIDAMEEGADLEGMVKEIEEMGEEVLPISSVTGKGLAKAKGRLFDLVQAKRTLDAEAVPE